MKSIKELNKTIKTLEKKFGFTKVNIKHEDGGEGIWAVPADKASCEALKNDSSTGASVFVRLCNAPLWNGFFWGSLVEAVTKGELRAEVNPNQKNKAVLKDQKELTKIIAAEGLKLQIKKEKKKK